MTESKQASRQWLSRRWTDTIRTGIGVLVGLVALSLLAYGWLFLSGGRRDLCAVVSVVVFGVALAVVGLPEPVRWLEAVLETQEPPLERRVVNLNAALNASSAHLTNAAKLISEMQQEIAARQQALEELNHKVAANEQLATVSADATAALDAMIESKMARQERRMSRVAWGHGAVFARDGCESHTAHSYRRSAPRKHHAGSAYRTERPVYPAFPSVGVGLAVRGWRGCR
ncbi:hypothetical protein QMK19_20850 [Streptomyces sp. H10-C2]|uniref:hypothetical protein n=1 Tax=unclassified Streptomyces TaxID=2593676 RepID=UPI0024BB8A00|nr:MULTISPECIES: hypothetical protein [unclassified Streptomyces]MDJ0344464.1 hypothetical protein [Streptomyces sp. PH10-H1]MDJ0372060.1 hypothetical protein [Streptomyces sp. H10-C2]